MADEDPKVANYGGIRDPGGSSSASSSCSSSSNKAAMIELDRSSVATSGLGESILSGDDSSSGRASQELLQQLSSTASSPISSKLKHPVSPDQKLFRGGERASQQPPTDNNNALPPGGGGGNNSKSWLLRLFESKLFDSSMAMAYMFNSKEPGVLGYIGNKLFTYSDAELDFYLPQMVNMYIMYHEVAEVLHPYLIHRCRRSVDFSLQCAWLLEAYGSDANVPSKKKSHGTKLKNLILSGELLPKEVSKEQNSKFTALNKTSSGSGGYYYQHQGGGVGGPGNFGGSMNSNSSRMKVMNPNVETLSGKKTHMRSSSDVTGLLSPNLKAYSGPAVNLYYSSILPKPRLTLGDLTSGRAFDNGCSCFESCKAAVNDLRGKKTHCKSVISCLLL